jgi:hypothetical protein
LRNACSVALDLVICAETLGSEDVRLFSGFVVLDEGDVARTAGIIFNSKDGLGTRFFAMVVDKTDSPPVSAATMTYGYLATMVAPAGASLCNCELAGRGTLPEVCVDGSLQMAPTWGHGHVPSDLDRVRYEYEAKREVARRGWGSYDEGGPASYVERVELEWFYREVLARV